MNNNFQENDILLLVKHKIYIHYINNILHIELFEEMLNEDDNIIIHEILDTFYDNCKKNNIFFYILYDFTNLSITSSSYLIYNSSIYDKHFNKHFHFFRTNVKSLCIIIKNYIIREALKNIIDIYKPENKPHIVESIKDTDEYFL